MQPIPCAHCGTNFMRKTVNPEDEKLCNNCSHKESQRKIPKEGKSMSVQLLVEVDRQTQIEIEEICLNEGLTLGQYVVNLHKKSQYSPAAMVQEMVEETLSEKPYTKKVKANKK